MNYRKMIIGIEGGIGTGKTLCLVHFGLEDLMSGKKLFSNITLKNIGTRKKAVTYLTKDNLNQIYTLVKTKKFVMKKSTVLIQEAHNYIDSRRSMFKDNQMITYWILQSRHFGEGSTDIIYDTQDIDQVDKRLRRNTDHIFRPTIIETKDNKPSKILINGYGKVGHRYVTYNLIIDVYNDLNKFDTHEIVEF